MGMHRRGSSCSRRTWAHRRAGSSQQIMSRQSSISKTAIFRPSCGMTTITPKLHLVNLQQSEILHDLASTGVNLFLTALSGSQRRLRSTASSQQMWRPTWTARFLAAPFTGRWSSRSCEHGLELYSARLLIQWFPGSASQRLDLPAFTVCWTCVLGCNGSRSIGSSPATSSASFKGVFDSVLEKSPSWRAFCLWALGNNAMYLIGFQLRSLLLKSARCFGLEALPYLAALNTR